MSCRQKNRIRLILLTEEFSRHDCKTKLVIPWESLRKMTDCTVRVDWTTRQKSCRWPVAQRFRTSGNYPRGSVKCRTASVAVWGGRSLKRLWDQFEFYQWSIRRCGLRPDPTRPLNPYRQFPEPLPRTSMRLS